MSFIKTSLIGLNLNQNRISNISPLQDLTSLTDLRLEDNPIADYSPLVSLGNLGENEGTDETSKYVGTWINSDLLMDSESVFDLLGGMSMMDFEFAADGTATINVMGEEVYVAWSVEGNIITIDGVDAMEFTIVDDTTIEGDVNGMTTIFEKQMNDQS